MPKEASFLQRGCHSYLLNIISLLLFRNELIHGIIQTFIKCSHNTLSSSLHLKIQRSSNKTWLRFVLFWVPHQLFDHKCQVWSTGRAKTKIDDSAQRAVSPWTEFSIFLSMIFNQPPKIWINHRAVSPWTQFSVASVEKTQYWTLWHYGRVETFAFGSLSSPICWVTLNFILKWFHSPNHGFSAESTNGVQEFDYQRPNIPLRVYALSEPNISSQSKKWSKKEKEPNAIIVNYHHCPGKPI